MKVLIIGSGGREHALAWKMAQSDKCDALFIAPGNAGTAGVGTNVDISSDDIDELARFAKREQIDLTVVGPEAPLVAGIVDRFHDDGLRVFGPRARAAQLEGSKVFSKDLMRRHGIPSADYGTFEDAPKAIEHIRAIGGPMVIKADGLAAGKGVIVCESEDEAVAAVEQIMTEKAFGEAGAKIVVEEKLVGEEASILALTDGKTIAPLASSQDHKPMCDGDTGPNTGGMGAYSPAPVVTDEILDKVVSQILVPTVHAMNKEGCPFAGVLYAGIMIDKGEPKVLEFNVRFGDPETQPILSRLDSDLVEVLTACADGRLADCDLSWKEDAAVCVVMASGGYPGSYEKGKAITGIDDAEAMGDATVFHAGTAMSGGNLVTAGGRVLGVTALGGGIQDAIDAAYAAVGKIQFDGAYYRNDIGAKALR